MNGTPGLLAKSAQFLVKHPVLLLPVLAARAIDFVIGFACAALRGPAMMAVAPRSVLGGVAGKVNAAVVLVAAFFTWLPMLCEAALFVYAMVVCAKWAHALREDEEAGLPGWRVGPAALAKVAAITCFLCGITIGVGTYLTLRGGVPVQYAGMVVLCFLVMASWFAMPSWLKLIAQEQGSRQRDQSQASAFVAFLLGFAVTAAILFGTAALQRRWFTGPHAHGPFFAFPVNLALTCLSALPLAFSFVAMSRHVEDRPGWRAD